MGIQDKMLRASEKIASRMQKKEIVLGSNKILLHNVPIQGFAVSLTEAELKQIYHDGRAHGYKEGYSDAKSGKEMCFSITEPKTEATETEEKNA